jgi:hypothetical protein
VASATLPIVLSGTDVSCPTCLVDGDYSEGIDFDADATPEVTASSGICMDPDEDATCEMYLSTGGQLGLNDSSLSLDLEMTDAGGGVFNGLFYGTASALNIQASSSNAELLLQTASSDWTIAAMTGTTRFEIDDDDTGYIPFVLEEGAGNYMLYVDSTAHVGVGTNSPAFDLDVRDADNGGVAELAVGQSDTIRGSGLFMGDTTGSANGGRVLLYTAADYDGTIDYYQIKAYEDDFVIDNSASSPFMKMGAEAEVAFFGAVTSNKELVVHDGDASGASNLEVGDSNTAYGLFDAMGGSGHNGGRMRLYVGDADNGTVSAYTIRANNDDMEVYAVGPNLNRMRVDESGAVWFVPMASAPYTCDSTKIGAMYFDTSGALCICARSGASTYAWYEMSGDTGSSDCS